MRFGRRPPDETEHLVVTPLINMVFLALMFFMATAVYGALEREIDIALPSAETALPGGRAQGEIVVNLRDDGGIVVNDRAVDMKELESVLRRAAEYFPGGAVVIRGDARAALNRAITVLDACRKINIENVSFAIAPAQGQS